MIRKKGEKGYRKYFRINQSIKVSIFIIFILIQVTLSRLNIFPNLKNILIVTAILTCLPMANLLTPLIASLKIKSNLEETYNKLSKTLDKSAINEENILYELIISTKKGFASTDLIYINSNIVYILNANNFDTKELEKFLYEIFKNNNLSCKLQISSNLNAFLKGIENIKAFNDNEEVKKLLKAISL